MSIKNKLFNIIDNYKDCTIMVIGDIIVDEYLWGKASRLSPEAPVPVLEVTDNTFILGGAANVASNIASLGAKSVIAGVIGDDVQSGILLKLLTDANIDSSALVVDKSRPTTVKTRLIAHNHQQLARADKEVKTPIEMDIEDILFEKVKSGIKNIDLIVLSDYAKGVLTDSLIAKIIQIADENNKHVLVDPKGLEFDKYKGATLITPNRLEAEVATKSPSGLEPMILAEKLYDITEAKHILVTLGEDGVFSYSNGETNEIPAVQSEVYDVTGAGDSLISALAVSFPVSKGDLEASIQLGNYAAGIAVRKTGTTTVSPSQLKDIIEADLTRKEKINLGA